MKRYIRSAVASLLIAVIVLTTYIPVMAVGESSVQPTKYSDTYNSGTRFVDATTLNGTGALSYYGSNYSYDKLSEKSSTQILNDLRSLMTNTHKKNSSYNDCWEYADNADCQNEDGKVYLIYTNVQTTYSNKNSGWNREHVWPKSLGGYETSGPGSDLHHIRPSDNRVNSCRNNLKYGNVSGGKEATGGNAALGISGGTYNSTYFEPHDNVKGDVARICLYMYVRYGGSWSKCSSITNVFQSVDVLLEWCALDPVDTWELGRNEVVEAYQGNRNVFIDYPEYAWLIFGRQVPKMTTPSGEANENGTGDVHSHSYTSSITKQSTCTTNGVKTFTCSCGNSYTESLPKTAHSYSNGICTACGASNGSTPACTHTNTELRNAESADCNRDGYTGDLYCKDCKQLISLGSAIPSANGHSFGDWELLDDGTYEKHCTSCGERVTLTLDSLLYGIESDAEKILILLTLGVNDSILYDALSK